MDQTVLQVSDFLALVNQTLEYAYPSVVVEGEVSSFKTSKGKFVFFDLKDDQGSVGCFMMIYGLRQPLEDGMRIKVVARPSLTAWGKFSLIVRDLQPVGEGSIKRAFELLKAKLEKEGLFDQMRKRLLPIRPGRIAVISSTEAAGYADFIKIINARWGGLDVVVANVQVQGVGAANQIINAINHFNQSPQVPDVIVLVRGGGSADDLAVFNDEQLVRAIAASRVPTLVGVGHEIDTSLADLAADVRAATPSNAAQILVPDRQEIAQQLDQKQKYLISCLDHLLASAKQSVNSSSQKMLTCMEQQLQDKHQQLLFLQNVLKQLDPNTILRRGYALVKNSNGKIIKAADDVKVGQELTITVAKAVIKAGVLDAKKR